MLKFIKSWNKKGVKRLKKLLQVVTASLVAVGIFAGVGATESKADFYLRGSWEQGKGQIGTITFLKDVKLYKRNADMSLSIVIGKKGQPYPVYGMYFPSDYQSTITYDLGGGIKLIPPSPLIKYENIQMPYIVKDRTWNLYAKVYGKPYEWVYVNYRKDDKWVKTDKVQLDQYGFVRTPVFDVKSYGPATWQLKVYYFSNKKTVATKALKMEEPPPPTDNPEDYEYYHWDY